MSGHASVIADAPRHTGALAPGQQRRATRAVEAL